ncbi:sensor histidine kinase (plasmid) [Streptomyces sp. BI20]|uniref:sensor histidine kinase n=1 Tax=Streptomyces sp. BI20 TaxID=3403460 RepID=UPI003C72C149
MTAGRPGRGGLSLGTRLVLVITAVFAVLGCGLLLVNWLGSRQLIEEYRYLVVPSVPTYPAATGPTPSPVPDPASSSVPAAPLGPARGFEEFRHSVLSALLTRSGVLLVVFTACAGIAVWVLTRRSLDRLTRVTAATRRIAGDGPLDERLALDGPRDEVRELADAFDLMLDRLERGFTAQRLFAAHASHELRTPLTLQRTALEIPLAQGRVPADLRPALLRALDANARSERLIAALLTLARAESRPTAYEHVELGGLARDCAAELADEAAAAALDVRVSGDAAGVLGDPALLRQLVLNLLANAVRHNHTAGLVRVAARVEDGRARLRVENTGPVMAPERLPALFEPFRRGDAAGPPGSGLGLTLVAAVARAHDGTVRALARPGGGLVVHVSLPHHPGAGQGAGGVARAVIRPDS